MTADTFTNFAESTISGGNAGPGSQLNAGDTTLILAASGGQLFPATGPFMCTLGPDTNSPEIVKCTARSVDTLTIVRGQENTTAQPWAVGTLVHHTITAGNMTNLWNATGGSNTFNNLTVGPGATSLDSGKILSDTNGGMTFQGPITLPSAAAFSSTSPVPSIKFGSLSQLDANGDGGSGGKLEWNGMDGFNLIFPGTGPNWYFANGAITLTSGLYGQSGTITSTTASGNIGTLTFTVGYSALSFRPGNTITFDTTGGTMLIQNTQYLQMQANLELRAHGAPASAPTTTGPIAGGSLSTGTYLYAYTYTSADGESGMSPTLSVSVSSGQFVPISSISLVAGASGINLYRTKANGSQLYFIAALTVGGTGKTTNGYNDTTADGGLNVVPPTHTSFNGTLIFKNGSGTVTSTHYNDGTIIATSSHAASGFETTTGYQETGGCGDLKFGAGAAATAQVWVSFRTKMQNVPSSITLSPTSTTNVTGSATATGITLYGFILNWTTTASGTTAWFGTYMTVGN